MLPEVKNGRLIRKRKHEPHKLRDIDPAFGEEYDDAKHGETLRAELKITGEFSARKELLPLSKITNVKLTLGIILDRLKRLCLKKQLQS